MTSDEQTAPPARDAAAAHPVAGVDHVFLLVHDLDLSCEAFARMGFTVSPRGTHSPQMGSANHTIMFERDYLELLGLIAETEANAHRRAALARDGEGLHAVACRVADARAAGPALAAHGIATEALGDFSRPVPLPSGGEGVASFTTLKFAPDEVPLGTCFMCQHRTPETVWIPELLTHRNGAVALAGAVAGVDAPSAAAEGFRRLFASGRTAPIEGGVRVETGSASAPLEFLTRAALAARYPAFDMGETPAGAYAALRVATSSLAAARSALEGGGFTPVETDLGVAIGPKEASGAVLEFVQSP